SRRQRDGERHAERHQRGGGGRKGGGEPRRDVARAALQQVANVLANQDRHENRRADNGNREQRLERRLRNELNSDSRPVCRGEQRAALEQEFQRHRAEGSGLKAEWLFALNCMLEAHPMRTLASRLFAGGLLIALAVAAAGGAIERARFGSTDDEALARVESELRRQFDAGARSLGELAADVRQNSSVIRAALRDRTESRRLFDVVSNTLARHPEGPTGVTIYDASDRPLAWAGRVSDL